VPLEFVAEWKCKRRAGSQEEVRGEEKKHIISPPQFAWKHKEKWGERKREGAFGLNDNIPPLFCFGLGIFRKRKGTRGGGKKGGSV